ncbi:hypothetical protein [Rhodoferax sp. GW822-FHT02A01]|uniref:hypothetical protein n=1 Tax=Rhodoferax sp. GW822-FHT02A01 TaxID=3141537 RepID=UPI00315DB843
MNITFHTFDETANILESATELQRLEGSGANVTHVLQTGGRNILLVVYGLDGESITIGECIDDENGSVHTQALNMLREAANDDFADKAVGA